MNDVFQQYYSGTRGQFLVLWCLLVCAIWFVLPQYFLPQLFAQSSPQSLSSSNSMISQSIGNILEWKKESSGIAAKTALAEVRLIVYAPGIVRVRIAKDGQFDNHSFAVIAEPQNNVVWDVKDEQNNLVLNTNVLKIVVSKKPMRVQFFTKQGKLLNEDEEAFRTSWIGTEVTTYKRLLPDERFIGLGEKWGGVDKRGNGYVNWNTDAFGYGGMSDPLYTSLPFYIGAHSGELLYGIFFDNSYKTHFNFGASNNRFSAFSAEAGEMNYYFMHGASVSEILEQYTLLTGRMELPPLWSLGYQQCRYSYFPDKEVLSVARTMREKGFPGDAIVMDIHYMDAYKVFTWHPERFPNPKKMNAELKSLGFHSVVIVDPGVKVETGYGVYEDGLKKDVFLKYPDGKPYTGEVWPGWCHFPDFTKPQAREWWGNHVKKYVEDGVEGFWNDMNEPATWGQSFPNLVEFDFDGNKATHKKGHNVFGLQMVRSTVEGAKKYLAGKRPFALTRAAYSGVQRYSAVWTGDNTATDEHLLLGTRLVASLGLAGVPFAGVDGGGFNGDGSKELFARWLTVGAFTPFFRVHSAIDTKEQDPWSFGETIEELCKKYIQLRYNLLPYLYSAFYEASAFGLPIARSLAIEHPFDAKIYDRAYQNQYMFGGALLIAPVRSNQEFSKVYLPKASKQDAGEWYDVHSDKRYTGEQEILVEAPLERLPVFVRGGSILPMQSPILSTMHKPKDTLLLHVYFGRNNAQTVYYEDDGESYKYTQGTFYKRLIRYDAAKQSVTLERVEGTFLSKFTHVKLIFHGFSSMQEVQVQDKKYSTRSEQEFLLPSTQQQIDPLGEKIKNRENASHKTVTVPLLREPMVVLW